MNFHQSRFQTNRVALQHVVALNAHGHQQLSWKTAHGYQRLQVLETNPPIIVYAQKVCSLLSGSLHKGVQHETIKLRMCEPGDCSIPRRKPAVSLKISPVL